MPSGGYRKNAPLFKSTWQHKETKVVRVPVVFADIVLQIARKLDAGEPLEEVEELVEKNLLELDWEKSDQEIQAALKEVPSGRRVDVRKALLRLLTLAYFQGVGESENKAASEGLLSARQRLDYQSNLSQEQEEPPKDWLLPEESLLEHIEGAHAALVDTAPSHQKQIPLPSETEHRIAGIALIFLGLRYPNEVRGQRVIEGKHYYTFIEQGKDLFVISQDDIQHRTVLHLKSFEQSDRTYYQINSDLTVRDIERFAVIAYNLEKVLQQCLTQEQLEKAICDLVIQDL